MARTETMRTVVKDLCETRRKGKKERAMLEWEKRWSRWGCRRSSPRMSLLFCHPSLVSIYYPRVSIGQGSMESVVLSWWRIRFSSVKWTGPGLDIPHSTRDLDFLVKKIHFVRPWVGRRGNALTGRRISGATGWSQIGSKNERQLAFRC